MDNLKLFVIYGIGLLTFSSCMVQEVFGDEAEAVVEDEVAVVVEDEVAVVVEEEALTLEEEALALEEEVVAYSVEIDGPGDGVVIGGAKSYHGLPSSVQSAIFDYLERYDLDALYSIMFHDRDYLLLSYHAPFGAFPGNPIAGYSFVLLEEGFSFTGPTPNSEPGDSSYKIGIEHGGYSTEYGIVDRSINFTLEADGSVSYRGVTEDFIKDITFNDPGVRWRVVSSAPGESYLQLFGSNATLHYASYSTDFYGEDVNRHWLMIKDYSVRVGRLTDYEKILLVGIVVIGYAFIRFFKFRS